MGYAPILCKMILNYDSFKIRIKHFLLTNAEHLTLWIGRRHESVKRKKPDDRELDKVSMQMGLW